MKNKIVSLLTVIYISFGFTFAQDEGLYAPAPPADAAFVRVVHGVSTAAAVAVSVGDREFGELSFAEVSPYRVVIRGDRIINVAGSETAFGVEVGKFYTLAVLPEGVVILEDAANENRAKALLSLYNLSDVEMVDLKTADGATDVLLGVEPQAQANIEVNGITVALGVFSNAEAVITFDEVKLERGAAYSAMVLGSADTPTVIWVQSETTTE